MSQATTWGAPRIADAPVTPEDAYDRIDDSLDALLSSHAGATRPTYAATGTVWHDTDDAKLRHYDGTDDLLLLIEDVNGDVAITNDLTVTAGSLIVATTQTPATAAAVGVAGTIVWDASYIYVCVATDTWERAAIATW